MERDGVLFSSRLEDQPDKKRAAPREPAISGCARGGFCLGGNKEGF